MFSWLIGKTSNIFVVVSLDHHHAQRGTVQLPIYDLGIGAHDQLQMRDILPDITYTWNGEWSFRS